MLMVVTGVGLLIHIYSVGYMADEDGYYRFFSYLNLFMFFMLVLVLAQNFLVLFVGWEGVGLCSYLLIGYYFLEQYATTAGNKAFIVNRIGDFGFSLAMFLIFRQFGSLDFTKVFDSREDHADRDRLRNSDHHQPAVAGGRDREIRADPAVCLAAGRDGRPHSRVGSDPRRHHGHRGRLYDCAFRGVLHPRAHRHGLGGNHRPGHCIRGRNHWSGADRHQESFRVFHGLAARLHVPRRWAWERFPPAFSI